MAREFVRIRTNSFLALCRIFKIQVKLQMFFLLNQEPRAARPYEEQNDNIRSELSLSDPEPYANYTSEECMVRRCAYVEVTKD